MFRLHKSFYLIIFKKFFVNFHSIHLLKCDIIKVSNCACDGAFFMPSFCCFVFLKNDPIPFLLCGNSYRTYMLPILSLGYTCVWFQGLTATYLQLHQL